MKTLTPEELEKKIVDSYNDHPPGWRLFYTIDKKGRLMTGAVNPKVGVQYWLCRSSQYGGKSVGFESTLDEDFPFKGSKDYDDCFGVRYLDIDDGEKEKFFRTGKMPTSVRRRMMKTLKKAPEPFDKDSERKKLSLVSQTINGLVGMSLSDIVPSQAELEAKMEEELARLEREYTRYIG